MLFKRLFCWTHFRGSLFSEQPVIGKNVAFQNGFGLSILKQLKTANSNSPWAFIQEGLLSEGYLRLRFGGLFSGGVSYFGGCLLSEFYGSLLRKFS